MFLYDYEYCLIFLINVYYYEHFEIIYEHFYCIVLFFFIFFLFKVIISRSEKVFNIELFNIDVFNGSSSKGL